jgi:hypothetical protein
MDLITIGQVVELRMGFGASRGLDEWREDDFETVATGSVWGLGKGRRDGEYILKVRDLIGTLGSRLTSTAADVPLFASVAGAVTTLASGYTAGDSTLVLTDASDFDDPSTLCGVKVTPTTGDPFYLTYTGVSTNTLTGVGGAVHGTTAVDADAGDAVAEVFYNTGHPLLITRRILASTGTANFNSDFDDLPRTHGYGLPSRLLDLEDMARWQAYYKPATGAASVSWLSEVAQSNGGAWLAAQLALTGCYLTTRQGRITARGLPDSGLNLGVVAEVTGDDIVSVDRWDAWAETYQAEYASVICVTPSGSTVRSEPINTIPNAGTFTLDASEVVKANEAEWRSLITRKLANWYCRWPEYIEATCAGWRLAGLAPGDTVRITAEEIPGRLPSTEGGYMRRIAVVAGVSPEWFGAVTRLQLYILPSKSDGF